MKRTKIISSLLSLSMLAALVVPGPLSQPVVEAADRQEQENEGMEVNKYAKANEDGTYTITLEAYATGEKITTEVTKEIPTDIILVLDQSGSMDDPMTTISFREYSDRGNGTRTSNEFYYSVRANQDYEWDKNLWYQPEGSNDYYSVSVVRTEGSFKYTPIERGMNNSSGSWGAYTNYWDNRNNLYALVDGEYLKVTVLRELTWSGYKYTYKLPSGDVIATSSGRNESPSFTGIENGVLYLRSVDETTREYTYTYTDASGQEVIIGTSVGNETRPAFGPFYERYEEEITRLEALKEAVSSFVDSINTKAAGEDGRLGTPDDINHRVAVVGFASDGGGNTELLSIDGDNSSYYNNGWHSIGKAYDSISSQHYKDVLQDMDTQDGQAMVSNAIEALDANGATRADLGMDMANKILNANPVDDGEKRARVVVFFTDGSPTNSSGFQSGVATNAISNAYTIKNSGATVYSVGIFDGANGTPVYSWEDVSRENQFMHLVSSNFKNAQEFWKYDVNATNTYPDDGSSYYLSANDSESLNSIFQQISDQIQEGGASTTLDGNAVIKDVIAPSFTLPEGTGALDIVLKTYAYGENGTWTENTSGSMGARADITGDTVSVTGFDFAENWCGTEEVNGKETYRGNKLVISFKVKPKDGFLGGNNVPTNTSAGVYENAAAEEPVFTFPVPEANVPIKDVTVFAKDKNVYLLGALTAEQIKSDDTAMCGNVKLDLAAKNYGLQTWQNDYVDITVTYKDTEGEILTDLKDLTEDATYTVEVTIKPKWSGEDAVGTPNSSIGETASDKGSINVFKPELTFTDGEVWYGGEAPDDDYSGYLEATQWKHQNILSSSVQMTGTEPKLELTYTPESGKITNGKIDTKDDISVDVAVKIGGTDVTEDTVFAHTPCDGKECTKPENGAFWLHVNTCQLTITKKGGAEDEPYVFTVLKDNAIYTSLTIEGNGEVTIKELPVGRYSIQEDEKWSWRYNGTEGNAVTLSNSSPSGSITCTNKKDEDDWLNGYSPVVTNIYGVEHTEANE